MIRVLFTLSALLLFISPAISQSEVKPLVIDTGNSQVLKIPGIKRIAVGNSQVIKAKSVSPNELLVFGLSSGSTSLEVWHHHGKRSSFQVEVISSGLKKNIKAISSMIANIPQAKLSLSGNHVVIEGENLSESDRNVIRAVIKRYPDVLDLTSQVSWERMVLLDVQVLEVPSMRMRELGVRWDPSAQGGVHTGLAWQGQGGLPSGSLDRGIDLINDGARFGSSFGLNALLSAKLHALTRSGEAVVLAQPQLLTRSGTTASFLAGGELPYTSVDKDGKSTTTFRKYGVSLNITPEVGRTDVVRSKIEIEVSSVDGTVTLPSGPALKIRKATSDFNVKTGQTLVIGGFISRERQADREGLPGLSQIPIAGYLFGSRREQDRETELAIFVTPVIMDSNHPSMRERVDTGKRITDRVFPDPALMNHALPISTLNDSPQLIQPINDNVYISNQHQTAETWFSSQWTGSTNE